MCHIVTHCWFHRQDAGGISTQNFSAESAPNGESLLVHVASGRPAAPASSQFPRQSLHTLLHTGTADGVLMGFFAANLVFAGVSSERRRTEKPPPCCNEIAADGTADFTYTYEVR
jgi:hypothetical protein